MAGSLLGAAAFLRDTAKLCQRASEESSHRQLTPKEVAERLVDTANILQALAQGKL
jgi:hypothetical protein